MISKKTKHPAVTAEDKMLELIDQKALLEPFFNELDAALDEARKGKTHKLKKLGVTVEMVRIMMEYRDALMMHDIKKAEYYGKIIRDQWMDKPKVSLEHSATEGTGVGVVVLPTRDKGEAD